MKKIITVTICVIVLAITATAAYMHLYPEYTLAGTVTSADDGQPVDGGHVTSGLSKATTDADGHFILELGRHRNPQVNIVVAGYDDFTAQTLVAKKSSAGLFEATLTQSFAITPTVQSEANRKWNEIKFGQYSQVWALINPDLHQLVPESKYVSALQQSVSQIEGAGGEFDNQTIASVTNLSNWTEPVSNVAYHNVKELQITQSYTILGVPASKNIVVHWAKAGNIWTFFVNPNDPSFQAE